MSDIAACSPTMSDWYVSVQALLVFVRSLLGSSLTLQFVFMLLVLDKIGDSCNLYSEMHT